MRAKFVMQSLIEGTHEGGHKTSTVKLRPVYSNEPGTENHQFWQATPSGSLEMHGLSKEVADQLIPGKEYFLDITPAD